VSGSNQMKIVPGPYPYGANGYDPPPFDAPYGRLDQLMKERGGICLDVCSGGGQPDGRFVRMNDIALPGVDVVHHFEDLPYPLPDQCCLSIVAANVVHRIDPARLGFIRVMNEWWRLLKPGGRLMISAPYGSGSGYVQDPGKAGNPVNEFTFLYFTIGHVLYEQYRPAPWRQVACSFHGNGAIEVVMEKLVVTGMTQEAPQ